MWGWFGTFSSWFQFLEAVFVFHDSWIQMELKTYGAIVLLPHIGIRKAQTHVESSAIIKLHTWYRGCRMYVHPTHTLWSKKIDLKHLQQHVANVKFITWYVHSSRDILWLKFLFGHIFVTFFAWSAVVGSTKCHNLLAGIVIRWTIRCLLPSKMFGLQSVSHVFESLIRIFLRHAMADEDEILGAGVRAFIQKSHAANFQCWHFGLWNLGYLMPGLRTTGCWHIGIMMLE